MDSDVLYALSRLKARVGGDRQKRRDKLRQLLEGMPEDWLPDAIALAQEVQAGRQKGLVDRR